MLTFASKAIVLLSLQEHIRRSREAVEANRAKGNRHAEILTRLYANPARFLDEVIQNTEDAYARKGSAHNGRLVFSLHPGHLDIFHDGRDFDEEDLKAITTFAGSTKDPHGEINQIGKFGIGFRSVYAVADQPEIHSGNWHFRIDNHEVLEEIAATVDHEKAGTLIRLPFRKTEEKKICNLVLEGLKHLRGESLLFLEQIRSIVVLKNGKLFRELECTLDKGEGSFEKRVLKDSLCPEKIQEYISIRSGSDSERFCFCFRLGHDEEGREILVRTSFPYLFVYFPTQQESHLGFLMHASFTTNPTREQIPFDTIKAPENRNLLDHAFSFLAQHLIDLREAGWLSPSFFEALLSSSPDPAGIHDVLQGKLWSVIQRKRLLPDAGGHYEKPRELAVAPSDDLIQLLGKADLQFLFQKRAWLHPGFRAYPKLLQMFEQHAAIRNIDEKSFSFRIALNPDFLKTRNRDWFAKFYAFISSHPELWDDLHRNEYYSLREKPIIRLQNGDISPAYDSNGNCLVHLPLEARSRKGCIDRQIAKDPKALNFFEMLGVQAGSQKANELSDSPNGNDWTKMQHFAEAQMKLFFGTEDEKLMIWGVAFARSFLSETYQVKENAIALRRGPMLSVPNGPDFLMAVREDVSQTYRINMEAIGIIQGDNNKAGLLLLTHQSMNGPDVIEIDDAGTAYRESILVFEKLRFTFHEKT